MKEMLGSPFHDPKESFLKRFRIIRTRGVRKVFKMGVNAISTLKHAATGPRKINAPSLGIEWLPILTLLLSASR
jgi:hypothetical protein